MDIAQLGYSVDSSQLQTATTQLDKNTAAAGRTQKATEGLEKQTKKLELSQKQLVAAQRQLPMQFTDIFVGLSSGQKPLQVLLQQGGQLKDVFGGVGPALRASIGYVTGLINPITLTAAALGGLALAWKAQQDQLDEFNLGLARTSNFIGLTAQELDSFSDQVADSSDATRGQMQETVNRIVSGGRLTQEQFRLMAGSTAEWAAVSGDSVDNVVKKYEALADDPVKALLKLNESEHFLTQAQYDRVKALVDEGKQQEAVTEAVRTYAEHMDQATSQVMSNLSETKRGWMEVKDVISTVWDEIGKFADGIVGMTRRQAEANTKLVASYMVAARTGSLRTMFGATRDYVTGIPSRLAGNGPDFSGVSSRVVSGGPVVDNDANGEQQKLQEQWERATLSNLSKQEKLEKEIADIRANGVKLGKSEADIQKAIADARQRYSESLPKGRKGSTTDPTDQIIGRLRQQIALNQEQLESEEKLTATERMLVQVRTQLDEIGGKGSATNRKIIDELLAQARATGELVEAQEKQKRTEEALARQGAIFEQQRSNQSRANEIDLLGMSNGSDATEMLRRQLDIQRAYQDELKRLGDRSVARDQDTWDQMAENARQFRDEQLQQERDFQDKRQQIMGDWSVGANKAYADYLERARDVAGQTEEIFGEAFQTLEDLGVDALSGNLDNWKDYFDALNQMILRFIVRQQLSKWMESINSQSGGGGSSGGFLSTLFGSLFSSGASGGTTAGASMGDGSAASGGWGSWVGALGAAFGGGRAAGGDVFDSMFYRVGEGNKPELLNMGAGRQFLIPGDRGNIDPIGGGGRGGGDIIVPQTINVVGEVTANSAKQMQVEAYQKMRQQASRN